MRVPHALSHPWPRGPHLRARAVLQGSQLHSHRCSRSRAGSNIYHYISKKKPFCTRVPFSVSVFHCRCVVCACSAGAVGSFSNKPLSPKNYSTPAPRPWGLLLCSTGTRQWGGETATTCVFNKFSHFWQKAKRPQRHRDRTSWRPRGARLRRLRSLLDCSSRRNNRLPIPMQAQRPILPAVARGQSACPFRATGVHLLIRDELCDSITGD